MDLKNMEPSGKWLVDIKPRRNDVHPKGPIPGVDSLSMLFSHRSFQQPIAISSGFLAVLERRIPGKNGGKLPLEPCGYEFE